MTSASPIATTGPVVRQLDQELVEEAASLLAAQFESLDAARDAVRQRLAEERPAVFGAWQGDRLIGAYFLDKVGMANEVTALVVAPEMRRKGIGRMCLYDALLRSGKRPLVIGVDEATLPFVKAVGFKMVGKLKKPDGSVRYRMGWHAPMPQPDGSTIAC